MTQFLSLSHDRLTGRHTFNKLYNKWDACHTLEAEGDTEHTGDLKGKQELSRQSVCCGEEGNDLGH